MVIFRKIDGELKRFTIDFCSTETGKTMIHGGWITLNRLGVFHNVKVNDRSPIRMTTQNKESTEEECVELIKN